ncbi:MAG: biopolymer transporter ExbD [Phycisphaeraceae bacterium]|nr:MAG: biopolymer transporter ExbD [Phycisphaeraceae bacterium]
MKFSRDHRGERLLDLDLTPMVDVVFLLIIFFMTTAQFARLTRAELDLPREPGEEGIVAHDTALVVNVLRGGEIIVDAREVPLDTLLSMVSSEIAGSQASEIEVLVRADLAAPSAVINAIAEGLTERGVMSWRLATETPAPGAGGGP